MAKTTTEPNEKREMIDKLVKLNAQIGADKARIEKFNKNMSKHAENLANIKDADIRNCGYEDGWEYENTINKLRLMLATAIKERVELQKQIKAKVFNILDEKSNEPHVAAHRLCVRESLEKFGYIDKFSVTSCLLVERKSWLFSNVSNPYWVDIELLVAPEMSVRIIGVSFHDIDDAVTSLKKLKVALGDMVILINGHVSIDLFSANEALLEDVIAANDRLALEIYALESHWWGDIND